MKFDRLFALLLVGTSLALSPACREDLGDDDDSAFGDDDDSAVDCTCEEGTLTVVSGCENFGGDETECTGWSSLAAENGFSGDGVFADGTILEAFGCSVQLSCN